MFLRIFQHLLPNAKAWRITTDKQLRQFFEGLTGVGSDVRTFIDLVYKDIDPQETRELDAWEVQFGLPNTLTIEQETFLYSCAFSCDTNERGRLSNFQPRTLIIAHFHSFVKSLKCLFYYTHYKLRFFA